MYKRLNIRKYVVLAILLSLITLHPASAQKLTSDFQPVADSLSVLIQQRTSVKSRLVLRNVMKRGNQLDFYFNESLSDIPWKSDWMEWFKTSLKSLFPEEYKLYSLGKIYSKGVLSDNLVTPSLTFDGKPEHSPYKMKDALGTYTPIVRREGSADYSKGLSGRHIALWQSHGRYYDEGSNRWRWQRPQYFTTVEDIFTQSFVLPYLIPMLENAGAYVMTPRERDVQIHEVVADNDAAFSEEREGLVRRLGEYSESGQWSDAGLGFADSKLAYTLDDNPFTLGTARSASVVQGRAPSAEAKWTANIPERGEYAVYVSYKTLENSTKSAHYTVHHLGGDTEFYVNQKMGGGTWIYLGTFEFGQGKSGYVTLGNNVADKNEFDKHSVVTADAVRFGGGMGKIARGPHDEEIDTYETSGMPAYVEGALYSMIWAGLDTTVTRNHKGDYTNDYASRGPWVTRLSGGSFINPKEEGKNIPFDLSLAWHSDAGVTPNDSLIGTLVIYTLSADGSIKYPNGQSRAAAREYADYVQTQLAKDLRAEIDPSWTRREIWNRNYSESRTPSAPALLLELLSHQNFADMKLGLDPGFRFTAARSVYKGMLKFLSNRYGFTYAVQPLPIESFAVVPIDDGTAELSWEAKIDELEPTAAPKGYILFTRVDNGGWDKGVNIGALGSMRGRVSTQVSIEKGHIYSFKVVAYNEGGKSFPSEVLACGIPNNSSVEAKKVLVVNNFDRVAPPAWFDTPSFAGFDTKSDAGVGYINNINYCGEQYQFRRELKWTSDDNPGFGSSFSDFAGQVIPGNTFDFVAVHGKAILEAGYPFYSASSKAFTSVQYLRKIAWTVDLLCGKQVTTPVGSRNVPDRFQVFPVQLQEIIREFTADGGNLLISGSNIGTDVWDKVYHTVSCDSAYVADTKNFVQDVLGYKWLTNYASKTAEVSKTGRKRVFGDLEDFSFHNKVNSKVYCVESPDAILPSNKKGKSFLRYSDTSTSAAVAYDARLYKVISFGFPLEVVKEENTINSIFRFSLDYFDSKQ